MGVLANLRAVRGEMRQVAAKDRCNMSRVSDPLANLMAVEGNANDEMHLRASTVRCLGDGGHEIANTRPLSHTYPGKAGWDVSMLDSHDGDPPDVPSDETIKRPPFDHKIPLSVGSVVGRSLLTTMIKEPSKGGTALKVSTVGAISTESPANVSGACGGAGGVAGVL